MILDQSYLRDDLLVFHEEESTFLFLVFDEGLRLLLVGADLDRGQGALTNSLLLFLEVAFDLVDVVCLDDDV
ncbi:hypothetical protein Tco_0850684 [Tanacetum coccineum]